MRDRKQNRRTLPASLKWNAQRKASRAEKRKTHLNVLDLRMRKKTHEDASLDPTSMTVWEPDAARVERLEAAMQPQTHESVEEAQVEEVQVNEREKLVKERMPFDVNRNNPFYKQLKRGYEAKVKAIAASEIRNEEIQAKADHFTGREKQRKQQFQKLSRKNARGQTNLGHLSEVLLERLQQS
ncbi:MAG: hypothetical protein KVP17_002975 [Porospora cf. gigantea B]|uniref:uncharacterized protein n=1 Tax=Porospora cf. gigantea B TaxID=2853592 RepID=UPI0035719460|nr:MAG: hypothetical protein KVP17_002975 [Porospora cf. gigantea B]